MGDGRVVFGGGLVGLPGLAAGSQVSFFDKYEDKAYDAAFDGTTWGSKSDMNLYMSLDDFNGFLWQRRRLLQRLRQRRGTAA